jgi:hypothetical protein
MVEFQREHEAQLTSLFEDFQTVATALASPNEHLLFGCVADALEFKQFYTSLPWAETEGRGEATKVHVVRVTI